MHVHGDLLRTEKRVASNQLASNQPAYLAVPWKKRQLSDCYSSSFILAGYSRILPSRLECYLVSCVVGLHLASMQKAYSDWFGRQMGRPHDMPKKLILGLPFNICLATSIQWPGLHGIGWHSTLSYLEGTWLWSIYNHYSPFHQKSFTGWPDVVYEVLLVIICQIEG